MDHPANDATLIGSGFWLGLLSARAGAMNGPWEAWLFWGLLPILVVAWSWRCWVFFKGRTALRCEQRTVICNNCQEAFVLTEAPKGDLFLCPKCKTGGRERNDPHPDDPKCRADGTPLRPDHKG